MGLVTLRLDSGPKLDVCSEFSGDQVCLGDLAVGGSFVFCLIIAVIFIGLVRAYSLWRGDFEVIKWGEGQATKGWNHFNGGNRPLQAPCKDFNLAIVGRLGWMKWLKNRLRKCLYFMKLFLHYTLFGENFIG